MKTGFFLCVCVFFFYQGFCSWILMTHRTAGEGRGPFFIPIYHFNRLRNFQTFICNFACEMTITNDYNIVMDDYHIFACEMSVTNSTTCIYQNATRWDFTPYRITIWLTDDAMLIFVCLLDDLILGVRYTNFTQETGGLELTSTITLVLQANRLNQVC